MSTICFMQFGKLKSLIDFEDSTWGRMFNFAKEMLADPEVMKPVEIQPESINIKDEVRNLQSLIAF